MSLVQYDVMPWIGGLAPGREGAFSWLYKEGRTSARDGTARARWDGMCNSAAHNARPNRESLSKRLGRRAALIRERDGHCCVYCGRTAEQSGAHLHLDHLTPKAAGGSDAVENLRLACRRCNSARQDLPLEAWAAKASVELGLIFSADSIRAGAVLVIPLPLAA